MTDEGGAVPHRQTLEQDALNDAVLYALRCGCFFPVPTPRRGASVQALVQWGAMRSLHDAMAAFFRGAHDDDEDRQARIGKLSRAPSGDHATTGPVIVAGLRTKKTTNERIRAMRVEAAWQ